MRDVWRLHKAVQIQIKENNQLQERNAALGEEVQDLKQGYEAIEERARNDLSMVKKDETFYQFVN